MKLSLKLYHRARSLRGSLPRILASRGPQFYRFPSPPTPAAPRPARSERGSKALQRWSFASSATAPGLDPRFSAGLNRFAHQKVSSQGGLVTKRFALLLGRSLAKRFALQEVRSTGDSALQEICSPQGPALHKARSLRKVCSSTRDGSLTKENVRSPRGFAHQEERHSLGGSPGGPLLLP